MKMLAIARSSHDIISQDYHVLTHTINFDTVNIYEGAQAIYAMIIIREITGLEAFSKGVQ
jgi:hypothetical protein